MSHLYLLAFRNLWQRKARTLLTLSGVALGVAFVLAVSITNASTRHSLETFFAQSSGRASLTIVNAAGLGVQSGIRASVLREAQAVSGVVAAAAVTSDSAILLGKDDTSVRITIAGIDPATDPSVRVYELASGRFLDSQSRSFEIVLAQSLAEKHGIRLDDQVETLIGREKQTFSVIGLLEDVGAARIGNGSVGFVTLDVAREVFGRGDKVDQVDLVFVPPVAQDPVRLEEMRATLQHQFGDTLAVSYPAAGGQAMSSALSSLSAALSAFSVIALIVSAILTYNTFSMIALERTREWGLLRSLGAGRGQLFGLVLVEASLLALIGSAMGLAGGRTLALPMLRMAEGMSVGIMRVQATVLPADALIAAALGVIVTLLASLRPAWNMTRITPMQALRVRADKREGFFLRHSWRIGLGLVALAAADQILSSMSRKLAIMPVELFLVAAFLGLSLLVPAAVGVVERLVRRAMAAIYGVPGRLGSLNIQRNRGRAALTVSVITIGAAMTIAMGGVEISFKRELARWVRETLTSDFVVGSSFSWLDTSYGTLPSDTGALIAGTPGVGGVTGERWMNVTVTGATTRDGFAARRQGMLMRTIDPLTYRSVAPLRFMQDDDKAEALWSDFAQGDALFVSGLVQQMFHVQRGDTLRVRTPRGERDLRVAGIVMDIMQGGMTILGSSDILAKHFGRGSRGASVYYARLAPGADYATVEQALKDGVGRSRHLDIVNSEAYRDQVRQAFDQFYALFDTVVAIAILVGALGVVNTMTMSILERRREIGMLRSLGMTRWQVAWMVLAEAAVMGVIAALMGIGAGLALTAVMIKGMSVNSGWSLSYVFPTAPLLLSIAITLVVSQAAAIYPTWRAVSAVVVESIQSG